MRQVLWTLVLVGCVSENNLFGEKDQPVQPTPDIAVRPNRIDFGTVVTGETAVETFEVKNQGDGALRVFEIRLEGDASFSFLTTDLRFEMEPEESRDIEVAFTPSSANNEGRAYIDSNDPDEPTREVELTGFSAIPELEITPDPLDMGETWVGCDLDNVITLKNVGGAPLTISDLEHDGDAMVMRYSFELPLVLEVGEEEELSLLFVPTDEREYEGRLSVTSNDPVPVREAEQTGRGVYSDPITERWELPVDPPSDILFFVDHSCSMDDDARAVADNFSDFIGALSLYTSDWHVIVTVEDDGCNMGGVLTPTTPGYASAFTNAATSNVKGVWTEAGFTIAAAAIDKTDSGECNDGFLRPDALLHLIMVSDEPEQSLGGWEAKLDQIIAKKGDPSLVTVSAIAGDSPSGCSSASNSADFGRGYYDAAADTGGEFLSICSNWASSVDVLANASVERSSFTLSNDAVEETITVTVNGLSRTSGWTYDPNTNTVEFTSAIPGEGDVIEITYSTYDACD